MIAFRDDGRLQVEADDTWHGSSRTTAVWLTTPAELEAFLRGAGALEPVKHELRVSNNLGEFSHMYLVLQLHAPTVLTGPEGHEALLEYAEHAVP